MYNLTGHSDANDVVVDIDPIHLIRRGVYDDWKDLELRVKALDLSLARNGTSLHSILSMKGKLLPHQLGACKKVLDGQASGALFADEVGLGKTIEAGMVISELICRGRAKRVLVLTPASLTSQWRDELRCIFDIEMTLGDIEARRMARNNGHTIWDDGMIISSIDTAKQRSNADRIQAQVWDVVVVDEAHKLKDRKTQNFGLVKGLRANTLLLLTATPIQNRLMELYNQISLIDPRLLGSRDSFRNRFFGDNKGVKAKEPEELRKRLAQVMIRNRRRNIPELDVIRRFGQTVSFPLSDMEIELYDEVTSFIKQEYLGAMERKQNARGYLMVLYQRMLTSSTKAISGSLRRRMKRVEDELSGGPSMRAARAGFQDDIKNMIDLEYNDARALFQLDMDPEKEDRLKAELGELRKLCLLADRIDSDTKAERLLNIIKGLDDEKVLVFTEFRATQRNLFDLLQGEGYKVTMFHGGMTPQEKDEAIGAFKGPCRVLISTESGGEGRNLQFCHVLINYDLPWNPMRVEQRIGRLHRIGQEHDVRIINFSTQGTIEEYVLDLLSKKIRLFEEVVGDLDIILGEVTDKGNLESLIMDILTSSSKDTIKERFDSVGSRIDELRHKNEEGRREGAGKVMNDLGLATRLDIGSALGSALDTQAQIKGFVEMYLEASGANVWSRGDWCLQGTAPRSLMVATGLDREFTLIFDRSHAQGYTRVAFGQPLLENILKDCGRRGFCAIRYIKGLEVEGIGTYHIKATLRGAKDHEAIHRVHVDLHTMEEVSDLAFGTGEVASPPDALELDAMLSARIEASYACALRSVESRCRQWIVDRIDDNDRSCDLMLERINTYYDDLEGELSRKEKVLEDEKYELVRRIRAGKDRRSRAKYRDDLKKVNRRYKALIKRNTRLRQGHRDRRLEEIRDVESKRALRPHYRLIAVGVSLGASPV